MLAARVDEHLKKMGAAWELKPPEQKAIAAALSDVDALLGALDRLIAKKRDLKQAAMQQLLTGQTRLPGFSGKWETKRLGEFADEQEAIAAVLADMDAELAGLEQRRDKTRLLKQGMMQELLTGRTRLV
jgi:restriction endonuclease S subunit